MRDVSGRVVLITGAGSGIGKLLATELAARGARLVLWDVDEAAAQLVAKEIEAAGGTAAAYPCDVADRHAVQTAAAAVLADHGRVDVLVNNAGVVTGARLLDLADEAIERTFAINVLAHYWTIKAFLPGMIERGTGHIVTVASAAGLVGVARQCDYSATKHAAIGFDASLRSELARWAPGVRTTVVCPFYVDTGMFEGARTRFPHLLPILRTEDVVRRIVRAIERDQARVWMPPMLHLIPLVQALPARWGDRVMDLFGVNRSMDEFVGRAH